MKHTESHFFGCNGNNLYYQYWLPAGQQKAVLIIVHGLAEHSGRYNNVIKHFVPRGYAAYTFDYRGHGKSAGKRGYVKRFSCYLDDLKSFFELVVKSHSNNLIFIIGHSIGATIAATFALGHQDKFDGLILSGATIAPGASLSPVKIVIANILSFLIPRMGIERIDASTISRNQAVVDSYVSDPLVYRGRISAHLGAELIRAMHNLTSHMVEIKLPVLIMHGTEDRLSNPESSRMLYQRVSSKDKTLKLYNNFYHEIFNEPGHEKVFKDMEKWLDIHVQ
ncbi:MAG: lysophospholipase [Dehalococcoidia bacterium]|nr:MAG: lysophospholipase [Dehalococcoidia bacterium]